MPVAGPEVTAGPLLHIKQLPRAEWCPPNAKRPKRITRNCRVARSAERAHLPPTRSLSSRFGSPKAGRRSGRYPARASVTTPVLRSTVRRRARESAVIGSSLDRTRSSIPSFSAKARACTSDNPMNSGACERVAASASLNLLSLLDDSTPKSRHCSDAAGKRSDYTVAGPAAGKRPLLASRDDARSCHLALGVVRIVWLMPTR
jgi:hypothetical protein